MPFADEMLIILDRQKELIEQQQDVINSLKELIISYGRPPHIIIDNKPTMGVDK